MTVKRYQYIISAFGLALLVAITRNVILVHRYTGALQLDDDATSLSRSYNYDYKYKYRHKYGGGDKKTDANTNTGVSTRDNAIDIDIDMNEDARPSMKGTNHKNNTVNDIQVQDRSTGKNQGHAHAHGHGHGSASKRTKSRSELIRIENEATEKIFTHYLMHIPKTGGVFLYNRLRSMVRVARNRYEDADAIGENATSTSTSTEKVDYVPCDEGLGLGLFRKGFKNTFKTEISGIRCNLWMTEQPIRKSKEHLHAYTIIRSPKEHVLSQYFHCKESKAHKSRAHKMPDTLDQWLDHHVARYENYTYNRHVHGHDHGNSYGYGHGESGSGADKDIPTSTGTGPGMSMPNTPMPMHVKNKRKKIFSCYDPINVQSYYTTFHVNTTEDDLYNRFDIIGDMDQMGKSVCAIMIRYMGYLPSVCDCSTSTSTSRSTTTTTAATATTDSDTNTSSIMPEAKNKNNNQKRRPHAKANANDRRRLVTDHGVKHHGATFNLTEDQYDKIEKITAVDKLLHQRVKHVFARQVKEIEHEFSAVLCENPDLLKSNLKNATLLRAPEK